MPENSSNFEGNNYWPTHPQPQQVNYHEATYDRGYPKPQIPFPTTQAKQNFGDDCTWPYNPDQSTWSSYMNPCLTPEPVYNTTPEPVYNATQGYYYYPQHEYSAQHDTNYAVDRLKQEFDNLNLSGGSNDGNSNSKRHLGMESTNRNSFSSQNQGS